jgi:hypothetical protein
LKTVGALLWQRLGEKTHKLIAGHIGEVEVGKGGPRTIVLDEESIEQLKLLDLDDVPTTPTPAEPPTASDVIRSLRERLEARLRANQKNQKTARWQSGSSRCARPTSRPPRRASPS